MYNTIYKQVFMTGHMVSSTEMCSKYPSRIEDILKMGAKRRGVFVLLLILKACLSIIAGVLYVIDLFL